MTDQITVPKQTWDAMREALNKLIKRDQRNTCQHEETHRGGAIWEICKGCGMKWADDRGGKPKWRNPPEWDAAELALTAANAVQPQAQGEAERLYDAIEDCLLNHRLHNFMEDDGGHYPLLDHLSHGDSIEDGRHEIRLICDSIYNTVLKPAHPQATEPAGWKLVPLEPTQAMLSSFYEAHGRWINEEGDDALIYRAMLAAAPEAKQ